MKKEHLWQDSAVELKAIALTAAAPIQGSHGAYGKRTEARYDMHYGLELGMVLSGRMKRYWKDWEMELTPGGVWLCGMWEPHGCEVAKAPCEVIVLVILPHALSAAGAEAAEKMNWAAPFLAPPKARPRTKTANRQVLVALGQRLAKKIDSGGPHLTSWLRLGLLEILLTLMEDWTAPHESILPPPNAYLKVHRAVEMVFENKSRVTVQEAARVCGMSRNAFGKLFASVMGLGFPQFSMRYRLSGAAGQLSQTGDAVKTAAAEWGFTDSSHLHRLFVRHYGCSPAAYRNSAAGGKR